MSRKHYAAIAKAINDERLKNNKITAGFSNVSLLNVARALAAIMGDDNPAFNHSRFLAACGFTDES